MEHEPIRLGCGRATVKPRAKGQSNYTVGKLVLHALNMLTGYSTIPLRMASLVGFLFTVFGIGVLIYTSSVVTS